MHPILRKATEAARAAGEIIVRGARNLGAVSVEAKGVNDFVSSVDREAEEAIITTIRSSFEDHAIVAEESGEKAGDGHTWIIDPLDGTTNFLHGFPHYAVSIAVARDGDLQHAVVYDPVRPELFTASRGEGTRLYGMPVQVSGCRNLSEALLGTGFPFKAQDHLDLYLSTFRKLFTCSRGVRRAGAASLDLAYVASGRLDGFWEFGLKAWDMAAGALLIQEAGGRVGDLSGQDQYLLTGNVVAANSMIFDEILTSIRPILPRGMNR